jgi:hypothetical protein
VSFRSKTCNWTQKRRFSSWALGGIPYVPRYFYNLTKTVVPALKTIHLELFRNLSGYFKPILHPGGGGFASETAVGGFGIETAVT